MIKKTSGRTLRRDRRPNRDIVGDNEKKQTRASASAANTPNYANKRVATAASGKKRNTGGDLSASEKPMSDRVKRKRTALGKATTAIKRGGLSSRIATRKRKAL